MNQKVTKVAFVDMDGTLIKGQTQQGLIKFFYSKGELTFSYLIFLSVWFLLYKIHLTDNLEDIYKFGLKYLTNKPVEKVSILVEQYLEQSLKKQIYPRSFAFLRELQSNGYKVIVLSAAIDVIVSKVTQLLKVDDFIATELEISNGAYTGGIRGKIVEGEEKVSRVQRYISSHGISFNECVAYGDRESDIPLLKRVQSGYIANPNKKMLNLSKKYNLGTIDMRRI